MRRILHITGSMDRAGAETMIMNLYRAIDKKHYQFDFVYFTDKSSDYDDEITSLGGKIYRIPQVNPIKRMFALIKLLKTHPEYKIVHAHTLFSIGFHFLAANIAGVSHRVAHAHSTNDLVNKSLIGKFYKSISYKLINTYSTHFISCGKKVAGFLFTKPEEALILPNAIDIEYFGEIGDNEKYYLQKEFSISENVLKVVQVGRLQTVKNPLFSIEVAKALETLNIEFKFFYVGQGSMLKEIQMELQKQQLEHKVILMGLRSDIPQIMAGADVLLMPSLHEGFPVVLVESQTTGLPALISDTISNEVDLGVGMIYFESINKCPSVWAEKLLKLNGIKTDKVKRIKKIAEQGYDINSSAQKLQNLYNTLE